MDRNNLISILLVLGFVYTSRFRHINRTCLRNKEGTIGIDVLQNNVMFTNINTGYSIHMSIDRGLHVVSSDLLHRIIKVDKEDIDNNQKVPF